MLGGRAKSGPLQKAVPTRVGCSLVGGVGWKEDVPELRGRGGEFHRHKRTVGVELRWTDDVGFHFFLGLGIFNREFCAHGDAFGQHDHCAAGAYGVRKAVQRVSLSRNVNDDGHLQQDALRATAFFGGLRTGHSGTALHVVRWRDGRCGVQFLRRRHSSIPQNSISGATSSTPYSQPSGC